MLSPKAVLSPERGQLGELLPWVLRGSHVKMPSFIHIWGKNGVVWVISQDYLCPQVELLVMKALSVGLVKGSIDEVDKRVHMTWVQPRVLDLQQVMATSSSWARER